MHARTQKHTLTQALIRTHARKHRHKQTYTPPLAGYTRTHTETHTHGHRNTHMHGETDARTHTHSSAGHKRTHARTPLCRHTRTYTHLQDPAAPPTPPGSCGRRAVRGARPPFPPFARSPARPASLPARCSAGPGPARQDAHRGAHSRSTSAPAEPRRTPSRARGGAYLSSDTLMTPSSLGTITAMFTTSCEPSTRCSRMGLRVSACGWIAAAMGGGAPRGRARAPETGALRGRGGARGAREHSLAGATGTTRRSGLRVPKAPLAELRAGRRH